MISHTLTGPTMRQKQKKGRSIARGIAVSSQPKKQPFQIPSFVLSSPIIISSTLSLQFDCQASKWASFDDAWHVFFLFSWHHSPNIRAQSDRWNTFVLVMATCTWLHFDLLPWSCSMFWYNAASWIIVTGWSLKASTLKKSWLQWLWLKLIALHRWGAVNRDHEWLLVHWGCSCPGNLSRHPKKSKLYSCPEGRAISGRLWTTIWWDTLPKSMDFEHPKDKLQKNTYIYIVYI